MSRNSDSPRQFRAFTAYPLFILVAVIVCFATSTRAANTPPPMDLARLADADLAINDAIARGDIPGAVLLVGRGDRTGGKTLYHKAYGYRQTKPDPKPMQPDTIFDLASLSKSVGCASSVMVLIEQGKIQPEQKISAYFPEFAANGKETITVAHLLLHQGGLIPDDPIGDYANGPAGAWEKICQLKPISPPGQAFKYSDVGFIVLGKLVEKVSGEPLDRFAKEHVFGPAGMTETGFNPPAALKDRFAPTEYRKDHWMLGEVHDPRSYALGGVAGHAGVFSTAADLSRFCRMLLNGGAIDGQTVMKKETVAMMLKPRALPDGTNRRTFGFDVDTAYSGPRGERFERGTTFGHTGFTGTAYWMDPVNDCYYILLTNSVHPDGKGKTLVLRKKIATIVGEALLGPVPATQPATRQSARADSHLGHTKQVFTGLDVLVAEQFQPLQGKRVALVTNQTGLDQQGRRVLDLLTAEPGVKLVKVFSPEHGLFGLLDEKVGDTTDPKTGLRVYSLYGKTNKPTLQMMAEVDVLLFDIQDAGARYYTYVSTMGLCMEACAAAKVKMMILDRPNPVTGLIVDGPLADEKSLNFTAYAPIPVSHGMTVGELAAMFNAERKIGCDLEVVKMTGWTRSMWFDECGLAWVNPSPNLRNPTQALLYLGVGQIEMTNLSVGRGTDQPFEWVGAPWIDGRKWAASLNELGLPGLRFTPIRFTPKSSRFEGVECQGVYIAVVDRSAVKPVRLGVALAWTLKQQFGDAFEIAKVGVLLKSASTLEKLRSADSPATVWAAWEADVKTFEQIRAKYLAYQ